MNYSFLVALYLTDILIIIINIFLLPAPGSYDVEKSEKIIHQSSGAITFGIRYKEQKTDEIPGKEFFLHFEVIVVFFFSLFT